MPYIIEFWGLKDGHSKSYPLKPNSTTHTTRKELGYRFTKKEMEAYIEAYWPEAGQFEANGHKVVYEVEDKDLSYMPLPRRVK